MSSIYPEIDEAVKAYESKLEDLAGRNAIDPPGHLKNKVLGALYAEIDKDLSHQEKGKVIALETRKDDISHKKNLWKFAAAASFTLFIISSGVFINSKSNYADLQAELNQTEEKLDMALTEAQQEVEKLDQSVITFENQLAFLSSEQTKQVQLKGTEKSTNASVSVYWNAENNRVLLKVNDLPKTPPSKQYQLWAIIDEQPTDMGMLPLDEFGNGLIEMPYTAKNPVAFAITLEEEGGKPEPNLDELYVIGNV
jgi:anti-sigma-K factor RskA